MELNTYRELRFYYYSRYANRSARFISAYDIGLSGAEAAWANKKYHGHRTLPPIILVEVRRAQIDMPVPLQ